MLPECPNGMSVTVDNRAYSLESVDRIAASDPHPLHVYSEGIAIVVNGYYSQEV